MPEYFLEAEWDESWVLLISSNSIGLPTSSLAICTYGHVYSVEARFNFGWHDGIKYFEGGSIRIKYIAKGDGFLSDFVDYGGLLSRVEHLFVYSGSAPNAYFNVAFHNLKLGCRSKFKYSIYCIDLSVNVYVIIVRIISDNNTLIFIHPDSLRSFEI